MKKKIPLSTEIAELELRKFRRTVRTYYRLHGRHDLPWRKTRDPYKILVSEIMLQQTQVSRVIPKYKSFLKKFPTVRTLAAAPLRDVLVEWQGLGYNRRGMYLKRCAEKIVDINIDFSAAKPWDFKTLCSLPGIGPVTAGDLLAFAWNRFEPGVPVIETNIRSVFIHFFFPEDEKLKEKGKEKISAKIPDSNIIPLIEHTLDRKNPREWYWALFDYGAYLKSLHTNPSRRSAHHVGQSRFEGSNRQKRATILRLVLEKPITEKKIIQITGYTVAITQEILRALSSEKLLHKKGPQYFI